ncbi:MAG: hypothetical protein FWE62_06080, partial [Firmicutes bacterium]|nr:hypothetical protein [Bacillota bacterium]
MRIFEGTAGKKVLFQPRINCWYDDKIFRKELLSGGLDGMTKPQMYRCLDVSNRLYDYYCCFERLYDPSVKTVQKNLGGGETFCTHTTPVGGIHAVLRGNDSNPGVYYKKWLVETAEDIKIKTYIDEATDYRFNQKTFDELYAEWGDNGAPTMYIIRTPIQECFVETMGVENTVYALNDEPELMEKYFAAKEESNIRMIREINKSPIRIINYGDNIHCGLTSPELFERYILPVYERRYPLLKGAGKFVHSHWDGDVASLLKYAQKSYLDGIEALTPFPQGDVSVEQIKDALGDKLILLDGIAALLFQDV